MFILLFIMVPKRRRVSAKRRSMRKRRGYKRRTGVPRSMSKVYSYNQIIDLGTITAAVGLSASYNLGFSLSNLNNSAIFASLYDQYRFTYCKLVFTPVYTVTNTTLAQNLIMYSVLDFNDSALLSSTVAATGFQSCKTTPFTRKHIRSFSPFVVSNQTDNNGNTYTKTYKSPWIATANPIISHLGVKMLTDLNTGTIPFIWDVNLYVRVEFKNVT